MVNQIFYGIATMYYTYGVTLTQLSLETPKYHTGTVDLLFLIDGHNLYYTALIPHIKALKQ